MVFFISDSAIPIAAYIQRAKGGVIPSIAPVITGSIAAAKRGFPPAEAKTEIIVPPKIFVWAEPGRIIPKIAVIKGMTKARAAKGKLKLLIYSPIAEPMFVDEKRLLMQYAKNMVAPTGTIPDTEFLTVEKTFLSFSFLQLTIIV